MPNKIVLSIHNEKGVKTVVHEIVHLMIQENVEKYKLEQFEKERTVDLILNSPRFAFLQYNSWQMNYHDAEKYIDDVFNKYFFESREKFFTEIESARKKFIGVSVVEQSVEPTQGLSQPPTPITQPEVRIVEKIVYKTDPNFIQRLLEKARAKIQERKRKKLDKIMALFEVSDLNLPADRKITNKDIQKLLRVSSATAVRYLDILELENRIKQVGNTGKSVFYTKI